MSAVQDIAVDLAAEQAVIDAEPLYTGTVSQPGLAGRFAALTIGQKIRVFFGTNLVFALLAGLFVVFGFVKLGQGSEKVASAHENLIAAERLLFDLSEAQRHTEMYLAEGSEERESAALDRLGRAEAKIAPLQNMVLETNAPAHYKLGRISVSIAQLRQEIETFDPGIANTDTRTASASNVAANGGVVLDAALEVAGSLGEDETEIVETETDLIWTLLSIWIGLTVTLTIMTLIADKYLHRTVSLSLRELTTQMSKLASGDRDVTVPSKDRLDEVGEMARAMVVFHRNGTRLERLSRERAERANAELEEQARAQAEREEARLERDRTLQDVADQFERTVGEVVSSVASASSQLHSTSGAMAVTAENASARISEVSQSMGEANRGATAAAAASDEFAMSIGEVSRQAASSAELARQATVTANEADVTISALSDSAEQVGQIVELIQTIAQRTNLLALNASIEAARGGEAGRGFAVVASEVKELAMQTSRATEKIAEQIRGMQDTTGASVNALRTIGKQVQELETTAVSIASAVDQQSVAGQDLARSIELAANGTEQVSGHLSDVHDLSLSTGSAAGQVLASATDLEKQSATLRAQVDAFLTKVRAG